MGVAMPIKRVPTAMFSWVRIRPMFEQEAPQVILKIVCKKRLQKTLRPLVRIRPENRPKGVKLRFEYDHIAPSGFGVANQEGTDSYVLFGSNTTFELEAPK